ARGRDPVSASESAQDRPGGDGQPRTEDPAGDRPPGDPLAPRWNARRPDAKPGGSHPGSTRQRGTAAGDDQQSAGFGPPGAGTTIARPETGTATGTPASGMGSQPRSG